MKRIFVCILAIMFCYIAFAEEDWDVPIEATELIAGEEYSFDLDGDGENETVRWESILIGEYDDSRARLTVTTSSGVQAQWESTMLFGIKSYACDLDNDGRVELFFTGDEMSDDYITACIRFSEGSLKQIPFANGDRGEWNDIDQEYGYGLITGIYENALELTGSQDILGTYFGFRLFKLQGDRFAFDDDGLWRFPFNMDDEDFWEYKGLTLIQEIPVTFTSDEGSFTGTLLPGTHLVVTATDRQTVVHFMTYAGQTGFFTISPDAENWGVLVNGIPEDQVFAFLPYAD